MGLRFQNALLSAGALFLYACVWDAQPGLSARVSSPQPGFTCAGCHAYPLTDENHTFHLLEADTVRIVKNINGSITCLDCHRGSIASHTYLLLDSICVDDLKPSGWSSFDETADFRKCMRKFPLARIDTVRQNRPNPQPEGNGDLSEMREWMTSIAHLNGTVDVEFDPRVSDTLEDPRGAQWDPQALTCSAVACHEKHGHYRFAMPSRGLEGLTGHHE